MPTDEPRKFAGHPDDPLADDPLADGDLAEVEEQFAAWAEGGVDGAPVQRHGLLYFTDDESHAEAQAGWARAKRRRWIRQTIMVLGVSVTALGFWNARTDLAYLVSPGEAEDLGSAVDRFVQGEETIPLPENRYVKLSGLLLTSESESGKFNYFYCPLYQIVVRTEKELPEQPLSSRASIEVDAKYTPLLTDRRAFPHDLTVFFEAQGRLMRFRDAPRWAASVFRYYAPNIQGTPEDAYLLLDGEAPSDFLWYGVGLLVALLLTGWATWSWWRARVVELEYARHAYS